MALGLFDRQSSLGLEVPEWVTLYLLPGDHNACWGIVRELAEGFATAGTKGITIVLGGNGAGWDAIHANGLQSELQKDIAHYRPWFTVILCNEAYFDENRDALAAGRGVVLRPPYVRQTEAPPPGAAPAALVGDWAVVIDPTTTLVGRATDPGALLAEVDASGPERPVNLPHWNSEQGCTHLQSTVALLAVNYACKPSLHDSDTFVFAAELLDSVVAAAFNERGLRPRWQQTETA